MHTDPTSAHQTSKLLRVAVVLGGLSGASGVALLAISAHADTTGLLVTAAQMLLFHAPAFLSIGLLAQVRRASLLPVVLFVLAAGVLLFSGDLASRVFWETRLFPMAAPTGGLLTILGWLMLALSVVWIKPKQR